MTTTIGDHGLEPPPPKPPPAVGPPSQQVLRCSLPPSALSLSLFQPLSFPSCCTTGGQKLTRRRIRPTTAAASYHIQPTTLSLALPCLRASSAIISWVPKRTTGQFMKMSLIGNDADNVELNNNNGIHTSEMTLEEIKAKLDELRNDPIFGDANVGINNNTQIELMKMMMEILQGNHQRERNEEEACSNMFKRFASHKPPTYDGKPNPTEFEEWLSDMEKLFDATQCPDKNKVNFTVFYLKGQANL